MSYVVYTDRLKGEYRDAFKKIELYGMTKSIQDDEFQDAMDSLLDFFLEAQENERDVNEIVGEDISSFSDQFFDKPNFTKNYINDLPRIIYRMACIAVFFCTLDLLGALSSKDNLMEVYNGYFMFLLVGAMCGVLISGVSNILFSKILIRKKKGTAILAWMQVIGLFMGGALAVIIGDKMEIQLPTVIMLVFMLCYIIVYKCAALIKRYRTKGSIKKTQEEKERGFFGIVKGTMKEQAESENLDTSFLKTLNARYERMNKRKGTTFEDFQKIYEKEQHFMERENLFLAIVCVIVAMIGTVAVAQDSKLFDICMFIVIVSVAEGLIWLFFSKLINHGLVIREKLLQRAQDENVTVMDIVKREMADS